MSLSITKQYQNILNNPSVSEEEVHQFIVEHPSLLPLDRPLENKVFSKLKLGNRFVVDFAFARMNSPGITWYFIEIEKPQYSQFNASGDPSADLTHGLRQILDWQAWFAENRDYFIKNYPFTKEMLKFGVYDRPNYYLIIGRREKIIDKNRARYRQINSYPVQVMSFDRLLENLDRQFFDTKKPIRVCGFVNGESKVINEYQPTPSKNDQTLNQ